MSKSTIISFYPLEFDEFVPFLFPSKYHIPASDGVNPQCLVIEDAFYLIDMEDRPAIKIVKDSNEVANSLVYDFKNSSLAVDEGAYPAVFAVPGDVKPELVKTQHENQVKSFLAAQRNWFLRLVRLADDDWQKNRQHKHISDLHRLAAQQLEFEREWMMILKEVVNCPACKVRVDPSAIVCSNCRCILQPDAYKKLNFAV